MIGMSQVAAEGSATTQMGKSLVFGNATKPTPQPIATKS